MKKEKYYGVHVTTEYEWDYVSKKLGYVWENSSFDIHRENSYIVFDYMARGDIKFETGNRICSFDEWLISIGEKVSIKDNLEPLIEIMNKYGIN